MPSIASKIASKFKKDKSSSTPSSKAETIDLAKEVGGYSIGPGKTLKGSGAASSSKPTERPQGRTRPPTQKGQTINLAKELKGMEIGPGKTMKADGRTAIQTQKTTAIQTAHSPLGNMERTYYEGLGSETTTAANGKTKAQKSARTATQNAQLGNMERTFIEGMGSADKTMAGKSKTQASRKESQSSSTPSVQPSNKPSSQTSNRPSGQPASNLASRPASQPARSSPDTSSKFKSIVPKTAISVLKSGEDEKMASRQTSYVSMSPAQKSTQDKWAKSKIADYAPCPEQYAWERIQGGYCCQGKHHYICDELLTEGRGGMWLIPNEGDIRVKWGPYYAEKEKPGIFFYSAEGALPDGAQGTMGHGLTDEEMMDMYYDYRKREFNEKPPKSKSKRTR
jgi:hypothetical protein